MNGKAPNFSLTGSQSLPAKNLKPKACQERPDPEMSSKTIRTKTPNTARPQSVIADLKMRSGTSPLAFFNSGAGASTATDVTFVPSTGCGPGISGRGKALLAIRLNRSRDVLQRC